MHTVAGCVIAAMNILSFTLMGVDKSRAIKNARRISETALLLASALFGAAGTLLAMRLFHHKTRHAAFTVGVPFLLIIQLVLLYLALRS